MATPSVSEKKRAYKRQWYLANRERLLQRAKDRAQGRTEAQKQARRDYIKAHRLRNPAWYKAYGQKMFLRHREKITAYRAWYYETHKGKRRKYVRNAAYARQYYASNKERIRRIHKRYAAQHRDEYLAYAHARRARLAGNFPNDLTAAQWREIKAAYGNRCVYCGKKQQRLSRDHITPVIKGGPNTRTNVVPACISCNSRKKAGGVLCPVQPLLLTIA